MPDVFFKLVSFLLRDVQALVSACLLSYDAMCERSFYLCPYELVHFSLSRDVQAFVCACLLSCVVVCKRSCQLCSNEVVCFFVTRCASVCVSLCVPYVSLSRDLQVFV